MRVTVEESRSKICPFRRGRSGEKPCAGLGCMAFVQVTHGSFDKTEQFNGNQHLYTCGMAVHGRR